MTRSRRNRFIERWAGREWALRQSRAEAYAKLRAARESGDVAEGPLSMGQDAGLIRDIPSAAEIVTRIAQEAEELLERTLPRLVVGDDAAKGPVKAAARH
jgi:NAD(P)H-dependent flavin oxidoreductase YrpB (nitropropane dioxygenase family)